MRCIMNGFRGASIASNSEDGENIPKLVHLFRQNLISQWLASKLKRLVIGSILLCANISYLPSRERHQDHRNPIYCCISPRFAVGGVAIGHERTRFHLEYASSTRHAACWPR
jgi:hypothetical protein